jgi:hypothetical protein
MQQKGVIIVVPNLTSIFRVEVSDFMAIYLEHDSK